MIPIIVLATTNKSKIRPFMMAWEKRGLDKYYQLINLADVKMNSKIIIDENTAPIIAKQNSDKF